MFYVGFRYVVDFDFLIIFISQLLVQQVLIRISQKQISKSGSFSSLLSLFHLVSMIIHTVFMIIRFTNVITLRVIIFFIMKEPILTSFEHQWKLNFFFFFFFLVSTIILIMINR
ncbi:hypothetical protein HanIR_Chr04g0195611 [Helianthus annuus]|nr:hypothetical protein HanIR_Chr04g0195611 [Helianthus annuus]